MGRLRHARTYNRDERGIAYRARAPRRRRAHSSRAIHAAPRGTGKPSTGRRGPGDRTSDGREVCVMQNAITVLDAQPRAIAEGSLESPVIGNGHAGFGRRTSEKDPQGHLADVVPRLARARASAVRSPTARSTSRRKHRGRLVSAAATAPHLDPPRSSREAPHDHRRRRRPRSRQLRMGDHPNRIARSPNIAYPVGWVDGGPATRGEPAS